MKIEAHRISYLLHKVAWTSTSELFEALEEAFKDAILGPDAAKLTPQLRNDLDGYIKMLATL